MNDYGLSAPIAFALALGAAGFMGFINGIILIKARINSFVVTLGTMLVYRGILVAVTGGFPVTVKIPPEVKTIVAGAVLPFGFQMSVFWFLLHRSPRHRPAPADPPRELDPGAGPEPLAARNLGVPVDRLTVILFIQCRRAGGRHGRASRWRASPRWTRLARPGHRAAGHRRRRSSAARCLPAATARVIGTVLGAITFGMIQVGLVLAGAPGHFFTTSSSRAPS